MDILSDGWRTMLDFQRPQAIFVALLSVLMPLSIFVGRRNVRLRRLRALKNLQEVISAGGRSSLPPGFTMVTARYIADTDNAHRWVRVLAWIQEIGIYLLPTLVFILLSGCGFALLFALGGDWLAAAKILLEGLQAESGGTRSFASATALVMGAGFAGAYIWSINYLILRVANFDLSPLSFLSTSAHILMTVFVAWVLRQVVAAPAQEAFAVAALLGIAFLSGLYPSLGLNVLMDRLPAWLKFKHNIAEAAQIERAFPLDLIDGIDATVKFRLGELGVTDVQNLATANPVELFVETPYGFGQILDWMAQSQLLIEVGPQVFISARKSGVRDIMALLELSTSDAGMALLKRALKNEKSDADDNLKPRIDATARKLYVRHLVHWSSLLSQTLAEPSGTEISLVENVTPLKAPR